MKVHVDGMYDAIQIHLSVDEDLSDHHKGRIERAIRIPMSGFVAVTFTPRRIIVTSSAGPEEKQRMTDLYVEAIEREFA